MNEILVHLERRQPIGSQAKFPKEIIADFDDILSKDLVNWKKYLVHNRKRYVGTIRRRVVVVVVYNNIAFFLTTIKPNGLAPKTKWRNYPYKRNV